MARTNGKTTTAERIARREGYIHGREKDGTIPTSDCQKKGVTDLIARIDQIRVRDPDRGVDKTRATNVHGRGQEVRGVGRDRR